MKRSKNDRHTQTHRNCIWLLMLPPLLEASAGNTFDPNTPILHTTPAPLLPRPLPSNILLVTIDATTLYTNIPHTHGLSALEKFLSKCPPASHPASNFLVSLTHLEKFLCKRPPASHPANAPYRIDYCWCCHPANERRTSVVPQIVRFP